MLVAEHGAEVPDVFGWGRVIGPSELPDWFPEVSCGGRSGWRRLWVLPVGGIPRRVASPLNVREFCWAGSGHLAAVASSAPDEAARYDADLVLISVTDARRYATDARPAPLCCGSRGGGSDAGAARWRPGRPTGWATRPSLAFVDVTAIRALLAAAVAVALAARERLLSATVADAMSVNETHDPDRELFGQGLADLVVPLFGAPAHPRRGDDSDRPLVLIIGTLHHLADTGSTRTVLVPHADRWRAGVGLGPGHGPEGVS